MKTLILLCTGVTVATISMAQGPKQQPLSLVLERIAQLQDNGQLAEATRLAQYVLDTRQDSLTLAERRSVEYELERSRRIRIDYSLTEDGLVQALSESVRDFTVEEFRQWEKEGRFDVQLIDGEKRFVGPSRSNLFFRYPELRPRRLKPRSTELEQFLWKHVQEIKAQLGHAAQFTVEPKHFRLHMTLSVKPDSVPEGEIVRCWMPFPQQFEAQSGVRLLRATPEVAWINAPRYPMRSLYFEQPSQGGQETVFEAEYTLTAYPRYNPIEPERVQPYRAESSLLAYYTRAQPPHVVFTPEIRELARELTAGERNPCLKARRIYDWISENIQYSYAREYSTLRNLSMYTYENGYGDCGQQALLFITLCRSSGIPARWQSGWVLYPMETNLHDWTEIFLQPYGWVPVDVNLAQFIEQIYTTLTRKQKDELKDFYFGGLDAYRLIANSDHGYPHYPPKDGFRSDDVDFQRGEFEAAGKNLYFDRFRYHLDVEYLNGEKASAGLPQEPLGPTSPGRVR